MVVAHNLMAMNSQRQLSIVGGTVSKKAEKLSSGYRINRAADDAAGLSISEKMRRQIRGLTQATENAEDGISMVQTADGALNEVHDMLQRMNELCVQAANGTNSTSDRLNIQDEISQLITEIDRVSETTKFNETNLLDGSIAKPGRNAFNTALNNRRLEAVKRKYEADKEIARIKLTALNGANAGKEVTADDIAKTEGIKIVYLQDEAVTATQTAIGNNTQAGYGQLKTELQKEIVPNAVNELIKAYAPAFNGLENSTIGIGLQLEDSSVVGEGTLAKVTIGYAYNPANKEVVSDQLTFMLSVNTDYLEFDPSGITSGPLNSASRKKLEVTIVHEMMHAFMDETLTNGMTGVVGGKLADDRFPKWFIEGMAQTAAGGYYDGNDFVNRGLGITTSSNESFISSQLQKYALGGSDNNSNYATGYLACMYLGYLAGGKQMEAANLRSGLASVLDSLMKGKSLQDVIINLTGDSSLKSFENGFAKNSNVLQFVKELTAFVGNGTGGAVAQAGQTPFKIVDDILADSTPTQNVNLFQLDITNDTVKNTYPGNAFEGGTATNGKGSYNDSYNDGPLDIAANKRATGFGSALHVGGEADMTNKLIVYIDAMDAESLGVDKVDVRTVDFATLSIERVALAIAQVSAQRSELGAYQNRLEHTINNLDNVVENTTAAESQIRDTDMAKEMVAYSNANILQQAGQSMLAQMNQINQGVLSLIA